MTASPTLFLDRDGTLIENRHYLSDPDGVCLLPGVADAMARLVAANCQLFLLTNQSGVGRGWFSLADVKACNRRLLKLLGLGSKLFRGVCIATEKPDDPPRYRKPSPRFIEEMRATYALAAEDCWMVGDSPADWQAGQAAGIRVAAVVPTTRPDAAGPLLPPPDIPAFEGFAAFVDWLLTNPQRQT